MAKDKRYYGDRKCISARVPDEYHSVFEALAAQENLSVGTWAVKKLFEVSDLPVPDFVEKQAQKNRSAQGGQSSTAA
ncbi:hypothetical protein V3C33_21045 (plasmid) [Micrococcaceae bacterium Sec5.7]